MEEYCLYCTVPPPFDVGVVRGLVAADVDAVVDSVNVTIFGVVVVDENGVVVFFWCCGCSL